MLAKPSYKSPLPAARDNIPRCSLVHSYLRPLFWIPLFRASLVWDSPTSVSQRPFSDLMLFRQSPCRAPPYTPNSRCPILDLLNYDLPSDRWGPEAASLFTTKDLVRNLLRVTVEEQMIFINRVDQVRQDLAHFEIFGSLLLQRQFLSSTYKA
jgi:hypothetical protein